MDIPLSQRKRFSTPSEIKAQAKTWESGSSYDLPSYWYPAGRAHTYVTKHPMIGIDANLIDQYPAQHYHSRSLIDSVIPKLLATNKKVKILELGAGTCLATDEIKNKFPDEVKFGKLKVYSTGLVKRTAQQQRANFKLEQLHRNDLKWRSVKQLSDFPEFHLIYETFGELKYSANSLKSLKEYLTLICKKLMPGGFASIARINENLIDEATLKFGHNLSDEEIDKRMRNQSPQINVNMFDKEELFQYLFKALNEVFTSIEESFAMEGIKVRLYINEAHNIEIQKAPYPFKPLNLFEWASQKKFLWFNS